MHRHSYTGRKLGRDRDARRALLKSLATSLALKEQITTTKPKAKELSPYFERLVTKAKANTLHSRRQIMAKISTEEAVNKLIAEIGPRFMKRNGGYTRIKAAGFRRGDNAPLVRISLVEADPSEVKAAPKKPATVKASKPVAKKPVKATPKEKK